MWACAWQGREIGNPVSPSAGSLNGSESRHDTRTQTQTHRAEDRRGQSRQAPHQRPVTQTFRQLAGLSGSPLHRATGRQRVGLEAQRNAIDRFAASKGAEVLARFAEVESGKTPNRPELTKAIQLARLTGATLVIAKLDRLSRNAAFLLTLRDSGMHFLAVDMPEANDLTVGIMALVAQQEREAISRRTKEGLAMAKARGVKLGTIPTTGRRPSDALAKALWRSGRRSPPMRMSLPRAWSRFWRTSGPMGTVRCARLLLNSAGWA